MYKDRKVMSYIFDSIVKITYLTNLTVIGTKMQSPDYKD